MWWKVIEIPTPAEHFSILRYWIRNESDEEVKICYERMENGDKGTANTLSQLSVTLFAAVLAILLIN